MNKGKNTLIALSVALIYCLLMLAIRMPIRLVNNKLLHCMTLPGYRIMFFAFNGLVLLIPLVLLLFAGYIIGTMVTEKRVQYAIIGGVIGSLLSTVIGMTLSMRQQSVRNVFSGQSKPFIWAAMAVGLLIALLFHAGAAALGGYIASRQKSTAE